MFQIWSSGLGQGIINHFPFSEDSKINLLLQFDVISRYQYRILFFLKMSSHQRVISVLQCNEQEGSFSTLRKCSAILELSTFSVTYLYKRFVQLCEILFGFMGTRKAKSPAGINQPCFTETVELCTCSVAADKLGESRHWKKEA